MDDMDNYELIRIYECVFFHVDSYIRKLIRNHSL